MLKTIFASLIAILLIIGIIFGLQHLDILNSDNNTTDKPTTSENLNQNSNSISSSAPDNHSRNNACEISFDTEYSGYLESNDVADWYKITTSNNKSAYRFWMTSDAENHGYYSDLLYMNIFDNKGIKIQEISIREDCRERFCDIYLDKNSEYTVKIYGNHIINDGNYKFYISEKESDAGTNKDDAKEITVGEEYSATMDTTLSDWYVFTADEGRYKLSLHNIDVGEEIVAFIYKNGRTLVGAGAKNEDSGVCEFPINSPDEDIHIEIKTDELNANGTYILLIEKI